MALRIVEIVFNCITAIFLKIFGATIPDNWFDPTV